MSPTRIPVATYRLQLNKDFRFSDAIRILDYMKKLGISDLYVSPILGSRKGSGHGYDVTDPTRINPELGSEEEFETFQNELQKRAMGLLVDIVPNHMAASRENSWWMDVLENGAESAYAAYFDIDWHPGSRSLDGKLLLPVLGRPFGEVIDDGELKLIYQEGRFYFQYFESLFPLAPRSYHFVLNRRVGRLRDSLGEESTPYHEYSGILASLLALTSGDRRSGETAADRRLRFEGARDRLWVLVKSAVEVGSSIDENAHALNGTDGDPASRDDFQRLLDQQNYKLAYWQNINESINYRRFFTIADLVGVRVEDPVVFEATHGHLLRLVGRGPLTGIRVDHIDGLRDPLAYLTKLQERLAPPDGGPDSSSSYLIVEKILARHEFLPQEWPVSGTTGYDYLNHSNGIQVNPEGAARIKDIYSAFVGSHQNFSDVLYDKKKVVMSRLLGVEMRSLGRQLAELAAQDRYARELPRQQLIDALTEVTACLPVYRTYIRNMEIPEDARKYIGEALAAAPKRAPHFDPACFDFVREVLLLENRPHVLADQHEARLGFVMRWQQLTGPIVAKGLEDTALYVFNPLVSLNDVGGDPEPSRAGTREEFLTFLEARRQNWPHTLNATSTHDTKRSEGVRARINVLSEMPGEWQAHLELWARLNAKHKQDVDGRLTPDFNEEYFLYQTLLGAWPIEHEPTAAFIARLQAYLVKATREAMVHTRWTRPNEKHEEALQRFVAGILSEEAAEFMQDFQPFQQRVAYYGMVNSLSQVLLKIVSPGVPDFYQGSELWDLRLVDPDNRGLVDFDRRTSMLETIDQKRAAAPETFIDNLLDHWHGGCIKMFVTQRALQYRGQNSLLFQEGEFIPLEVTGRHSDNVVAFLRRYNRQYVLTAVPRWLSQIAELPSKSRPQVDWQDTAICLPPGSPGKWTNIFTGKTLVSNQSDGNSVSLDHLLKHFHVSLLDASASD
jgi:(1->4)-alpha-D-glucan 1-alpha-D-glucosylmutase